MRGEKVVWNTFRGHRRCEEKQRVLEKKIIYKKNAKCWKIPFVVKSRSKCKGR